MICQIGHFDDGDVVGAMNYAAVIRLLRRVVVPCSEATENKIAG
jgi:hypothetical protein